MRPGQSSTQAGFTLAETLVALFILALVSAAGSGLLMGATASGKHVREREAASRQLDIAQAFLRNDIANMSMRAVRPDDGFSRPGNLFGKSATGSTEPFLTFVRSGWINPGGVAARSNLQLVRYRLEDRKLIRSVLVRPDEVNSTPVSERVLLEGVSDVEMRFQRGGQWSPDWIGDAGQPLFMLPDMVEVKISFRPGEQLTIAALTGARS